MNSSNISQRLFTEANICSALAQSIAMNGKTPAMAEACALAAEDLQAIADEMAAGGGA
ncbi:MAG: hypothetical protein WA902_03965 [Thermosynechococcaceae cyanobacterium]